MMINYLIANSNLYSSRLYCILDTFGKNFINRGKIYEEKVELAFR